MDELDIEVEDPTTPLPRGFDKLPPGWEMNLLALFEEGCTNEEVIAWLTKNLKGCFSKRTFEWWYSRVPRFKEVINIGNIYKRAWWLKQGRTNISNGKFNTPLYIRMMSNLFGWHTETSTLETVGDKADLTKLSNEELDLYRKMRDKMKRDVQAAIDGNGIAKKQANVRSSRPSPEPEFAGTGRD